MISICASTSFNICPYRLKYSLKTFAIFSSQYPHDARPTSRAFFRERRVILKADVKMLLLNQQC